MEETGDIMPMTSLPLMSVTIVGRDRERAVLRARLAATRAGHGGLVLIAGEAGIGKSTLAAALAAEVADAGAIILAGHCYDRTETPPYAPWIEIAQHFQSLPLAPDAPPLPRLDAATSQADLFAQIRAFLVALTALQPVLLVLEDLHWADSATLDLLRFLARSLASLSLMVVVTYRDEEVDRRHPLTAIIPLLVREAAVERPICARSTLWRPVRSWRRATRSRRVKRPDLPAI